MDYLSPPAFVFRRGWWFEALRAFVIVCLRGEEGFEAFRRNAKTPAPAKGITVQIRPSNRWVFSCAEFMAAMIHDVPNLWLPSFPMCRNYGCHLFRCGLCGTYGCHGFRIHGCLHFRCAEFMAAMVCRNLVSLRGGWLP